MLSNDGMVLDVPLHGKQFTLKDKRYLSLFVDLQKNMPCTKREIIAYIGDEIKDTNDANCIVKELIDSYIILETSQANPLKEGVRFWLDNGWIDALLLHFCTRDLAYEDDSKALEALLKIEKIDFIKENVVPDCYQHCQTFSLLDDSTCKAIPSKDILTSLLKRHSFKPFIKKSLDLKELSCLLYHANQYTVNNIQYLEKGSQSRKVLFDSAFVALETYVINFCPTKEVLNGLYFYDKKNHALRLIKKGAFRKEVSKMCIGQSRAGSGVCSFVIVANWNKYQSRYKHSRAYRNLLINTAELAQYYLVLATYYGFNTFITPAMIDNYAANFLEVPEGFSPLYVVSFG